MSISNRLSILRAAGLVLLLACARGPAGEAPAPAAAQEPVPVRPLVLTPLAGEEIPVLPLTMVVAEPGLGEDSVYAPWRDRVAALRTADTIVGEALTARGPEVKWILPPQLRQIARRSPGMVGDPDQLGQAMMRNPRLERLPDNFRQNIRGLVAVAGNRYVLIPAALGFGRTADGQIQADLALVLADVRNGRVLWRSGAVGQGATPRAALEAAMAAVLPLDLGS